MTRTHPSASDALSLHQKISASALRMLLLCSPGYFNAHFSAGRRHLSAAGHRRVGLPLARTSIICPAIKRREQVLLVRHLCLQKANLLFQLFPNPPEVAGSDIISDKERESVCSRVSKALHCNKLYIMSSHLCLIQL